MRPCKCGRQGFGAIQIRLDDFVGEFAMLGRIASQGAYLELIAGLKGAYYRASLLTRCAQLQRRASYLCVPYAVCLSSNIY